MDILGFSHRMIKIRKEQYCFEFCSLSYEKRLLASSCLPVSTRLSLRDFRQTDIKCLRKSVEKIQI